MSNQAEYIDKITITDTEEMVFVCPDGLVNCANHTKEGTTTTQGTTLTTHGGTITTQGGAMMTQGGFTSTTIQGPQVVDVASNMQDMDEIRGQMTEQANKFMKQQAAGMKEAQDAAENRLKEQADEQNAHQVKIMEMQLEETARRQQVQREMEAKKGEFQKAMKQAQHKSCEEEQMAKKREKELEDEKKMIEAMDGRLGFL